MCGMKRKCQREELRVDQWVQLPNVCKGFEQVLKVRQKKSSSRCDFLLQKGIRLQPEPRGG